ncbi:glycerol-3-phosphate dehydrogenase subunit GlpB [Rhodobium gokarnense]|uniref:Glycerol-3-phosphate dehydrogenase subunit B n=1 Tax=Rhodobium gokarnense TaxID=364296 RepID=A0ABT3H9V4_9HYPH|nr:glycerol-3-phosphate dehydrogenase subunit GlpB [Rhodobium gokarnense]MCW2307173.1 glycerol-3-phosphate dehydrogenase subunit B [Rhodobium gokarnense]
MEFTQNRSYSTRLAVIGSGLAGFSASIFALDRGITPYQIGNTGPLAYTTGYFDLLGYLDGAALADPWAGIARLRAEAPEHPLARVSDADVRAAFSRFCAAVTEMGISYTLSGGENLRALLPAGLSKPTLSVPATMIAGVEALAAREPALVVDFVGLPGFSAREFAANFKSIWPTLEFARLGFPEMETGAEVYPEVMARALEVPAHREALAERIRGAVREAGEVAFVGLPAILGVHAPDRVHKEMERLVGLPIFEIPTMPPAVPGLRLRELFEQVLPERGLVLAPHRKVERLELRDGGAILHFTDNFGEVTVEAEAVILATGRFLSGGLAAERGGIRETLLDLPVEQPETRADWYREDYFDPRGHAINRAGLLVDDAFRVLGPDGGPVSSRLFAAGAVLARQDWVRQRCGAGIALATAFRAVEEAAALLEERVG